MQCNKTTKGQPFFFKIFKAFLISFKLEAPVDKKIIFLFFPIFSNKGRLVISAEAILKYGTRGSKNQPKANQKVLRGNRSFF